jgi:hypothetical protein
MSQFPGAICYGNHETHSERRDMMNQMKYSSNRLLFKTHNICFMTNNKFMKYFRINKGLVDIAATGAAAVVAKLK